MSEGQFPPDAHMSGSVQAAYPQELDDPKPYGTDFPLCKNCGRKYLDHIDVDYGASGLELCPTYKEYESGLERVD